MTAELGRFAPLPHVIKSDDGYTIVEHNAGEGDRATNHLGRMRSFHGQAGVFVRALTYILSHGSDGLRKISEDAVLNANYIAARLKDDLSVPYPGPYMHEVLFDDTFLNGTDVTTLDFAKAMIDEGYHPATIYFPLVVHGALLTEPTESESKQSLDQFIETLKALAADAKSGKAEMFKNAPVLTPVRRLDETRAARQPVLRWRPAALPEAAE